MYMLIKPNKHFVSVPSNILGANGEQGEPSRPNQTGPGKSTSRSASIAFNIIAALWCLVAALLLH